jgi:hypothetical protein
MMVCGFVATLENNFETGPVAERLPIPRRQVDDRSVLCYSSAGMTYFDFTTGQAV